MAVPTENLISDISALGDKLTAARTSIGKRIIGQPVVVDLALTALLSGGHALLVGGAGSCQNPACADAGHRDGPQHQSHSVHP